MEDRHQIAPYPLRMSAELRKRLEAEARAIGRSLNAEIIARLEASFEATPQERSNEVISTNFDERLSATVRQAIESVITPEAIDAIFKRRAMQFVIENPDGTVSVVEPKSTTKAQEPVVTISGGISPDAAERAARIVRRPPPKKTTEK